MRQQTVAAATLTLFTALAIAPVAGADGPPNLLANGSFSQGLSGWSRAESVSWSGDHGGAARVVQTDTARGADVLLQCVAVESGRLYDLSASAFLPEAVEGSGGVSVRVRWHAGASCVGQPLSGSAALDFSSTPDASWQRKELRSSRAPEGALSALVLAVARADARADYQLLVDDLVFARSTESETLTLPTAASLTGAYGQRFRTDLWIHNPVGSSRRFVLKLYPAGWPHGHVTPVVLNLGPDETRFLPDVLRDVFGAVDRAGALQIDYDPVEGPLLAAARAVTVHPEQPGNGMGIPVADSGAARASGEFLGVPGDGSRVNAGAFNPSGEAVRVTFVVRDANGQELRRVERTWGAYEWFQVNDVVPAGADVGAISVRAERPVLPFAIAIDNRSGDPTYLPLQAASR